MSLMRYEFEAAMLAAQTPAERIACLLGIVVTDLAAEITTIRQALTRMERRAEDSRQPSLFEKRVDEDEGEPDAEPEPAVTGPAASAETSAETGARFVLIEATFAGSKRRNPEKQGAIFLVNEAGEETGIPVQMTEVRRWDALPSWRHGARVRLRIARAVFEGPTAKLENRDWYANAKAPAA